jgi:hypothetical protein
MSIGDLSQADTRIGVNQRLHERFLLGVDGGWMRPKILQKFEILDEKWMIFC